MSDISGIGRLRARSAAAVPARRPNTWQVTAMLPPSLSAPCGPAATSPAANSPDRFRRQGECRKVAQAIVCDDKSGRDRDSLNLNKHESFELASGMRCESADFIEARSGRTGCNKAGYRAAAHPVRLNTRKS